MAVRHWHIQIRRVRVRYDGNRTLVEIGNHVPHLVNGTGGIGGAVHVLRPPFPVYAGWVVPSREIQIRIGEHRIPRDVAKPFVNALRPDGHDRVVAPCTIEVLVHVSKTIGLERELYRLVQCKQLMLGLPVAIVLQRKTVAKLMGKCVAYPASAAHSRHAVGVLSP